MSRALTHQAMLEAAGECYDQLASDLSDAKEKIVELEERNARLDEELADAAATIRTLNAAAFDSLGKEAEDGTQEEVEEGRGTEDAGPLAGDAG